MAHRPSGPGRISRRFRPGPLAAAGAGAVVVVVALAVGISQATASPACASVITPATTTTTGISGISGPGAPEATLTGARATGQTSGEATHYELAAGVTGNCSYPSPPAGQLYVALPPPEYGGSAACGSYLQVSGPDGSVTVEVVDQCPECQAGHIDLSEQAFARIAPLSAGLVPVSYRTLADPPLPAPLSMLVKTGSSAYYLALLPINNGNPLAAVAVRQDSGGWQELARTAYGYWLASSGAGPGPFTIRLTDSLGHQATVSGITISPGAVQVTGTPMYGAAAAPAATTAAPAVTHQARRPHPRRHARATPSPAPARVISVAGASAPAAASATPSCP